MNTNILNSNDCEYQIGPKGLSFRNCSPERCGINLKDLEELDFSEVCIRNFSIAAGMSYNPDTCVDYYILTLSCESRGVPFQIELHFDKLQAPDFNLLAEIISNCGPVSMSINFLFFCIEYGEQSDQWESNRSLDLVIENEYHKWELNVHDGLDGNSFNGIDFRFSIKWDFPEN